MYDFRLTKPTRINKAREARLLLRLYIYTVEKEIWGSSSVEPRQ